MQNTSYSFACIVTADMGCFRWEVCTDSDHVLPSIIETDEGVVDSHGGDPRWNGADAMHNVGNAEGHRGTTHNDSPKLF
jgi:hypothetical protein